MLLVDTCLPPHWASWAHKRWKQWRAKPAFSTKYKVGSLHWAAKHPGDMSLSKTLEEGTFLWNGQVVSCVYLAEIVGIEDYSRPIEKPYPSFPDYKYRIKPVQCAEPEKVGWVSVYEQWLYPTKEYAEKIFHTMLHSAIEHEEKIRDNAAYRAERLKALLKEPA